MSKPNIEATIKTAFSDHKVDNPALERALTQILKKVVDYDKICKHCAEETMTGLRKLGTRL